jgi:hypothetical protein
MHYATEMKFEMENEEKVWTVKMAMDEDITEDVRGSLRRSANHNRGS